MQRFIGKTIIITGAAGGIGGGTAEAFAEEGANVAICDYDPKGQALSDQLNEKGYKTIFVQADVSKEEDLRHLVDKTVEVFGTVDILFNNVGILSMTPFQDLTMDEWHKIFRVNLDSHLLLGLMVAPIMKKNGKGAIINASSVAGYGAHHGFPAYVTSKHAVRGLTKSMAWELGPEIRANAIAPGAIHTPMVDSIGGPEAIAYLKEGSPLKRYGSPRDIANVVMFLASDESSFVTGQVLSVDGGIEI